MLAKSLMLILSDFLFELKLSRALNIIASTSSAMMILITFIILCILNCFDDAKVSWP